MTPEQHFYARIRERQERDRLTRAVHKQKSDAFAAAMQELFRQHPISGPLLAKQVGKNRAKWLGRTKQGFVDPTNMAAACVIPVDQVKTIHALIFG